VGGEEEERGGGGGGGRTMEVVGALRILCTTE
jgi:hypothetical protein